MPSCYTAKIEDDPNYTFQQFVWSCARGFGALIMMRDEPHGTPIPLSGIPSGSDSCYHQERLKEAKGELKRFREMTEKQWADFLNTDYENRLQQYHEHTEKVRIVHDRYAKMRAAVADWFPPTKEHDNFKEFMINQIDESLEYTSMPETPNRASAEEFIESAKWDVDYHSKRIKEDSDCRKSRSEWIVALDQSVPRPPELIPDNEKR